MNKPDEAGVHGMSGRTMPLHRQIVVPRRSKNGHHPDCPYPGQHDVEHCHICQGIRKGGTA